MRIEELLEKKEQLQVTILRQLVLRGGQASLNELRHEVDLSKSSFDSYLEEIELIGLSMQKK